MRLAGALLLALAVFALDQASKYWVLEVLRLREVLFIEVTPFLNFAFALNRGVNFGLFASNADWQPYALATFKIVASLALFIWAARTSSRLTAIGCGVVAGGALANATDRLSAGAVIDFLNFDCCGIGNPYSFNIADAGVFLGAALIAWSASGAPAAETEGAP